ncbi:MAG: multidrug effflux MFS transporter [Pseudomonadota bacterium]
MKTRQTEFIVLMAFAMSMVALSIDAMLPALSQMAADLSAAHANDRQLIISAVFVGMGVGQLVFGVVSDTYGRKAPMILGIAVFVVGSVISARSDSMQWMLIGRVLQGFGAAAPRTICVAIIRDCSAGAQMARIMSLVMTVFIFVPVVAPLLGQLILYLSHWRTIFWAFVFLAALLLFWFWIRQPETLPTSSRTPLAIGQLGLTLGKIVTTRQTLVNTLAASVTFGAFIGYLNTSQQILQEFFATGVHFAFYFGVLAAAIGLSSFVNSHLVSRFGLRSLCRFALGGILMLSLLYLSARSFIDPSLRVFMVYMLGCFFCIGTLFSNFNALAMEPMGKMAGIAASVTGSIQTILSLSIGFLIGRMYTDSELSLAAAFSVLSSLSLIMVFRFDPAPADQ